MGDLGMKNEELFGRSREYGGMLRLTNYDDGFILLSACAIAHFMLALLSKLCVLSI